MRLVVLTALLPFVVPAQPGSADQASVEGSVLSTAGNEPVKKASVTLRRTGRSAGTEGAPSNYTATTDAGGRYSIRDVEPGTYRISVRRTGFVDMEYGARAPRRAGTVLTLGAGQQMKDVNIRLTPHGVITGRVLDEDGDPMANVRVDAMQSHYNQGRKQLMPAGGASTDDLGEYRIFGLAPGKYYLTATGRLNAMGYDDTLERSTGRPDEDYAPTFYPGSTDAAGASVIDVLPGAQMRGINFNLTKIRTVRVRGQVANIPGGSRQTTVMLLPRDRFGGMNNNRATVRDPQGRFEIRGVVPGAYMLLAAIADGKKTLSARQPLDVGASDLDNIQLNLTAGAELGGRVRVEGQAGASLTGIHLTLQPYDGGGVRFGPMESATVKQDGSFTISNVAPDRYILYPYGLPDGYWVKSIRHGSEDVTDQPLDFLHGVAGSLDILISPTAGQIEGTVMSPRQEPAAGATVVLIPQAPGRRGRGQYYKTVSTDQDGRFSVKNVDPGDYKVYAWEDVEPGAYMDPDFVKPVENLGQAATVHESGHEKVQLDLIPADASASR